MMWLITRSYDFNWNMENHPEKTVQPQGPYGSGLGWLIRNSSLWQPYRKGKRGCIDGVYLSPLGVATFAKELIIRECYALLWLETLADCHLLGNLCKGLVASLCNHTSEVWYCAWSAHAWLVSKFFGTFTRIVVKVYNICRVKTNRLAVLTVKSGLDPHMII